MKEVNEMFEFEMYNVNTKETKIVFGYSLGDVRRKYPEYQKREWVCTLETYVDWLEEKGNEIFKIQK